MNQAKALIVSIVSAVILTAATSLIQSPWQTYPNGVARYAQDKGTPDCDFPPQPGASCSDVRSIDYGFPWHTKKVNDGIFYNDANFYSGIKSGTFHNLAGTILNSLFYFAITLFFIEKLNRKGNPIWKISFILLFIVDAIVGYLLYSHWGEGADLIKASFLLLPVINLLLLFNYNMHISGTSRTMLLKFSFILLVFVNMIFGFNVHDQGRSGIGLGFLAIATFVSILAINDLVAVLFYVGTQHSRT